MRLYLVHKNRTATDRSARKSGFWCTALLFTTVLVACSVQEQYKTLAETLIENHIGPQFGLDIDAAYCEEPTSVDVGSTFSCTATSSAGDLIYEATVVEGNQILVTQKTSVLSGAYVTELERSAVRVLEESVGIKLGENNFDCGTGPMVLAADAQLECELKDPETGDRYPAVVEILDFELGTFDVDVAEEPTSSSPE